MENHCGAMESLEGTTWQQLASRNSAGRPEKAAVVIPTRVFSRGMCAMCCLVHGFMRCGTHFALGYDGFIFDLRLVQGYREVRFVKLSTQLVLLQLLVV